MAGSRISSTVRSTEREESFDLRNLVIVGCDHDFSASLVRHALLVAEAALGEKLTDLIWNGPAEALTLTENAQPALMAVSIAAVVQVGSETTAVLLLR